MNIKNNIINVSHLLTDQVTLVAVSKTYPADAVKEAYDTGHRHFGENRVQELLAKAELLPSDIHWHLIGHLQSNKVKYIAPFVHLIHSIDSPGLLQEVNKQGKKISRIMDVLLQVHIAAEETKFGFDPAELVTFIKETAWAELSHVRIRGLMGMATNTSDTDQVRREFRGLKGLYDQLKATQLPPTLSMEVLSMGMSSDFRIAMEEGSTMVRIGSAIFGAR